MNKFNTHCIKVILVVLILMGVGCDGKSGVSSSSCNKLGPGDPPISGMGTASDPYIIVPGVSYGGCASAGADPGPIYKTTVDTGVHSIRQSNGVTDMELYIYLEDGNLLSVVDDKIAGFDEQAAEFLSSGSYGVEVFNNGPGEGPFTLRVD